MVLAVRDRESASVYKRAERTTSQPTPGVIVVNQILFRKSVAVTASTASTTTATTAAATSSTSTTEGVTTSSAATALERLSTPTTSTTAAGKTPLDAALRLLDGALSTATPLRNVDAGTLLATALVEITLWSALHFTAAEVLTLRHDLLPRGQPHHTLLHRTFQTALHIAGQLLDIAGNLTARTIAILDALLTARIRAAVKIRTLCVGTAT